MQFPLARTGVLGHLQTMRIVIHQFPPKGPQAPRPPGDAPQIDMTPDGSFVEEGRPGFAATLGRWAATIAAVAAVVGLAALAFWMAIFLLPLAIAAGLIAYAAFRWRVGRFRF